MKINDLKKRLRKDRPKTAISLMIPEDVLEDLQRITPLRGFSDYHALIRAYIGQGLRADLERFEGSPELSNLIESLRRHGVDETVIATAMSEVKR
ncbi:MAG: hypothetical protein ACREOI_37875 [bacterium]